MDPDIPTRVSAHVREVANRVSIEEQAWLRSHVVTPRLIRLSNSLSGPETIGVWLVTDHIGVNDASYRIVYLAENDAFGYECTLEDDREFFVGQVGTLEDALEGL